MRSPDSPRQDKVGWSDKLGFVFRGRRRLRLFYGYSVVGCCVSIFFCLSGWNPTWLVWSQIVLFAGPVLSFLAGAITMSDKQAIRNALRARFTEACCEACELAEAETNLAVRFYGEIHQDVLPVCLSNSRRQKDAVYVVLRSAVMTTRDDDLRKALRWPNLPGLPISHHAAERGFLVRMAQTPELELKKGAVTLLGESACYSDLPGFVREPDLRSIVLDYLELDDRPSLASTKDVLAVLPELDVNHDDYRKAVRLLSDPVRLNHLREKSCVFPDLSEKLCRATGDAFKATLTVVTARSDQRSMEVLERAQDSLAFLSQATDDSRLKDRLKPRLEAISGAYFKLAVPELAG